MCVNAVTALQSKWPKAIHIQKKVSVYNFDIFNDAMFEIPNKLDKNLSVEDRAEVDTILEYLKSQHVVESDDEVKEF